MNSIRRWCFGNCYRAAEGLDTGKEYEFRVLAKNLAGLGEPSQPSKSVVTKPKAGQYRQRILSTFSSSALAQWRN